MKRLIKSFLEKPQYIRNLYQEIENQGAFPAGHYYSPIPDRDDVHEYVELRKPLNLELPDVKLNKERQFKLLNDYFRFYDELPFPEKQNKEYRYYYDNNWYSYSDAIFLYSFLRKHEPKRIIEIGSGFSSAVMLDTVDGFFSHRPDITFIDPYPDRLNSLLRNDDEKHVKIINKKVQEVLKFLGKVSCRNLHERGREGIYHRFAWKWANQLKIFVQCCLGNQSPDIGKGEMVSAFDRMPARWSFVQVAGINPGD